MTEQRRPPVHTQYDFKGLNPLDSFNSVGTLNLMTDTTAGVMFENLRKSESVPKVNTPYNSQPTVVTVPQVFKGTPVVVPTVYGQMQESQRSLTQLPLVNEYSNSRVESHIPGGIGCHVQNQSSYEPSVDYSYYNVIIPFRGTLNELLMGDGKFVKEIDFKREKLAFVEMQTNITKQNWSPEQMEKAIESVHVVLKDIKMQKYYNNSTIDLSIDSNSFIPVCNYDGNRCSVVIFSTRDHVSCNEIIKLHTGKWDDKFEQKIKHAARLTPHLCKVETVLHQLRDRSGMIEKYKMNKEHPIYQMIDSGMFFPEAYKKEYMEQNQGFIIINKEGYEKLEAEAYQKKATLPVCQSLKFKLTPIGSKLDVVDALFHRNQCCDNNGKLSDKKMTKLLNDPFEVQISLVFGFKFNCALFQ